MATRSAPHSTLFPDLPPDVMKVLQDEHYTLGALNSVRRAAQDVQDATVALRHSIDTQEPGQFFASRNLGDLIDELEYQARRTFDRLDAAHYADDYRDHLRWATREALEYAYRTRADNRRLQHDIANDPRARQPQPATEARVTERAPDTPHDDATPRPAALPPGVTREELEDIVRDFVESHLSVQETTALVQRDGTAAPDLPSADELAELKARVAQLESERAQREQLIAHLEERNTENERELARLSGVETDAPHEMDAPDGELRTPTPPPPPGPWTGRPGAPNDLRALLDNFARSDRPGRRRALTIAKTYLALSGASILAAAAPVPAATCGVIAGGAIAASEAWMHYMPKRQVRRAVAKMQRLTAALPDLPPAQAQKAMDQLAALAWRAAQGHGRAQAYEERGFMGRARLVRSKLRVAFNRTPDSPSPGVTRAREEIQMHDAVVANYADDFLAQQGLDLSSLDEERLQEFAAAATDGRGYSLRAHI